MNNPEFTHLVYEEASSPPRARLGKRQPYRFPTSHLRIRYVVSMRNQCSLEQRTRFRSQSALVYARWEIKAPEGGPPPKRWGGKEFQIRELPHHLPVPASAMNAARFHDQKKLHPGTACPPRRSSFAFSISPLSELRLCSLALGMSLWE
jgi:hypothetical protein